MAPQIVQVSEMYVVGISVNMQRHETHKIMTLWQQFSPRKHEINNLVNSMAIAMQTFTLSKDGEPNSNFNMWACVEVSNLSDIPKGMEGFIIPKGDYVKVLHKGMNAGETYQRIMTEWLPNSGYVIDDRPHFQVMGEKYKNGSPDSEEDFYVPVKPIS